MRSSRMKHYSVLDLVPIAQGADAAVAFRNARDLARHAEAAGYHRYWIAEHHNIPGVASAATSVVIGHVAAGTSRIRVGSGGIMLPNHAPLVIAEQFGTLASLHPGRIDLGLGRAPGGDPTTARALRRGLDSSGDTFGRDLAELRGYFDPAANAAVRAVPGAGIEVPVFLLGSSDFSAHLAAQLGLPFAFASHFAPDYLLAAIDLYRRNFQPSAALAHPHVIVGVNVIAADTDAVALRLFTSIQQAILGIIRGGQRGQLPPPVADIEDRWHPAEASHVARMLACSAVGSPDTVRETLADILDQTEADEIIVTAQIHDHAARVKSFEIAAGVLASLTNRPAKIPA